MTAPDGMRNLAGKLSWSVLPSSGARERVPDRLLVMAGLSVLFGASPRNTVSRGVRLAWLTILWNVAEAAVALIAGGFASSTALVAFGLDSAVESASGAIALRRLRAEAGTESREAREVAERRAQRGIAASLLVL